MPPVADMVMEVTAYASLVLVRFAFLAGAALGGRDLVGAVRVLQVGWGLDDYPD